VRTRTRNSRSIPCGSSLMRWSFIAPGRTRASFRNAQSTPTRFAQRIHSFEAFQQPIPPPVSLTAEEQAGIIARSYRYDREWEAKGASGRAPREYDRPITFVLTSGALFKSPGIDADMLQFWFLSNPYPGIICGSEGQADVFGIYSGPTPFAAYFNPEGKLAKIAEPARMPQESLDRMYADRLNGPLAASDEAALFRICGIIAAPY
jgi:hypothetical protein